MTSCRSPFILLCVLCFATVTFSQTETATVSGRVTDQQGALLVGAEVVITNTDTNVTSRQPTNKDGLYVVAALKPGRYRITVSSPGFRAVNLTNVILNVQDSLSHNFTLQLGSVSESVTVVGDQPRLNADSATVSTVVDRNFAENLPMNGRSFQSLIQLTPGVVLTANNGSDDGQFSVNGQRAASNYWMVDGVGANIGISALSNPGNGLGGTLGSSSALGGTNSLVSVDALQEFRIQTSTFAPEFGRTPGGQISIVTRSGTNQFHGTAFDYLRNDIFDASNWFNGYNNNPPVPKAKERQNDFGGTLGGPIFKDRTFFFFSYEGLRLRLPQTALTNVPDLSARQNATAAMAPYLNAYPLPRGPEVLDSQGNRTGAAQFDASFSNPASLDAYSLRIDHKMSQKVNIFGRYNYSPSQLEQRGLFGSNSLSTVTPIQITTQTGTLGITWSLTPTAANDFRFNYSSTDASSHDFLDNFGGAVPVSALPFPSPFTVRDAYVQFQIFSLGTFTGESLVDGKISSNYQRQVNVVDSVSVQKRSHSLKVGVDFRRLSPRFAPPSYLQQPLFLNVSQAETGDQFGSLVQSSRSATLLFRSLGAFAQDTWRIIPRVTLTYGVRWDVEFVPTAISGPNFSAVTGFSLRDLSKLTLAPAGTALYNTTYGNVSPRVGVALRLSNSEYWQRVLRSGFGIFYDLATSEAGNIMLPSRYPFGSNRFVAGPPLGGTARFPLSDSDAMPPAFVPPGPSGFPPLSAFDPRLQLPYTLQWNVALEQALGKEQTITASYIGSLGKRLIQTAYIQSPNQNFGSAQITTNAARSDYNALQVQFQRRLSHGIQALGSYSWSHSIDTASAGSLGNGANGLTAALSPNANRSSSDFDIRNAFSLGLTFEVPVPQMNSVGNALLRGWSTENIVQARSAPPVNIYYSGIFGINGFQTSVRPDLVPGNPLELNGSRCLQRPPVGFGTPCPGGKGFNSMAFTAPPMDPNTGTPLRQGNLGRNALLGFGDAQWDFAVRRDFAIHESIKLQFRAELFNVLNHPNFGQPIGDLGSPQFVNPQFGVSTQTLGQSLAGGNLGGGSFNPLYQVGGPRSIQLALKLLF